MYGLIRGCPFALKGYKLVNTAVLYITSLLYKLTLQITKVFHHTTHSVVLEDIYYAFDATKFVMLGFFTLIETSCSKMWTKSLQKKAKSTLPVDERRLKTPMLKVPNIASRDM